MRRIHYILASCAIIMPIIVAPAAAQSGDARSIDAQADSLGISEIVVTAQKREQSMQKVPITVSALSSEALVARGLTNVQQLQGAIPGLQFQEQAGIVMPFLRGVGNSGNTISNESSVALYVDGVYFSRLPAAMTDLNNVQRVEVLKGPQGTLFGRNSTGGVINIVTRDPSHETSVRGSIGYGRFDAFNANLYATTGLSDTVAIDFSLSGKTDDGFGRTRRSGKRYGWRDDFIARSKLLFEPSDAARIVLSGFYNWSEQSGQKAAYPGTSIRTLSEPFEIITSDQIGYHNSLDDEYYTFKVWGGSLKLEQDLSFARFTSISAYTHHKEFDRFDGDHTHRDDFSVPIRGRSKTFTQEFQLANSKGSSFDWIIGAFYYNNVANYYDVQFISPLLFGPDPFKVHARQKARSYAAFAQTTYEVLPRLKITGGIRYTVDKTTASGKGFAPATPDGSDTVKRATFKASADYEITDDMLLYALFSRGFKSGNFNLLTYDSNVPTRPEGLDAYEIGFKADLFDRRLRLNGAAFYYDISSPQVQLTRNASVFFSNAGSSRVKGVEIEGQAILFPGFTARFNAQYLDSKYRDYKDAPFIIPDPIFGAIVPPAFINGKNASGNWTPQAAKWTFGFGGDYVIETSHGTITLTADYYHNSGYFFQPDNVIRQPAYDLLSGQIKFAPTENLAVRFWGRNLTNSRYAYGEASQTGPGASFDFTPAPPRTYGIAVDFKF